MKNYNFILGLLCLASPVRADEPWFTGTLLARTTTTIPKSHCLILPYVYDLRQVGYYDSHGENHSTPIFRNTLYAPYLTYGLTDNIDIGFNPQYISNSTLEEHYHHIGDTSIQITYQLYDPQNIKSWLPALRLVFQETLPSGAFDNFTTDTLVQTTGLGSYQTLAGLSIGWLKKVGSNNYLRSSLNLSYNYFSSVLVHGYNAYGGALNTRGTVYPGSQFVVISSFEYTLSRSWGISFDVYYQKTNETRFRGNHGYTSENNSAYNMPSAGYQWSLAPALEYNFNENIGIISGIWFTVKGMNSAKFITPSLGISWYI